MFGAVNRARLTPCPLDIVPAWEGAITVWNSPADEVPHLYLRLAVFDDADDADDASLQVELDFRPRLNAGYQLAAADDGSFPPPASREEFAMSSLRARYDAAFFDEIRTWIRQVRASDGAKEVASTFDAPLQGRRQFGGAQAKDGAGMLAGPLLVCQSLPLNEASVDAATSAVARAASFWLGWKAHASPASWMNHRMQYDRDCQIRQTVSLASGQAMRARFGAAGLALAQDADGRLDMAGHNLMQEQGGFGSDPDEGRD